MQTYVYVGRDDPPFELYDLFHTWHTAASLLDCGYEQVGDGFSAEFSKELRKVRQKLNRGKKRQVIFFKGGAPYHSDTRPWVGEFYRNELCIHILLDFSGGRFCGLNMRSEKPSYKLSTSVRNDMFYVLKFATPLTFNEFYEEIREYEER